MHWITLVRDKLTAGWDEPEPPPSLEIQYHCGGNAMRDEDQPLPEPKPCTWCGRMVRARVVERWEARCFREVFEPGTMQSWDKKYRTPIKMRTVGYPCFCTSRDRHWIVIVAQKKTAGWESVAV